VNVIEIKNLTKIYKKKRFLGSRKFLALNKLNLEVEKGEIFGFLGPNGSGKTTTIKLMLGLLFPTDGECLVFGRKAPSLAASSRIGYIPEIPYLYRYLTPKEVLRLYGIISSVPKAILEKNIDETLELVKMKQEQDSRLGEFSKGMLQRVGVAQSLIHGPELLVLDEPFTGLDPIGLKDMRDIILKQKNEGRTVFFSSHIISEAEKICNRVAIIFNGHLLKVVEMEKIAPGTLEDIFIEEITKANAN